MRPRDRRATATDRNDPPERSNHITPSDHNTKRPSDPTDSRTTHKATERPQNRPINGNGPKWHENGPTSARKRKREQIPPRPEKPRTGENCYYVHFTTEKIFLYMKTDQNNDMMPCLPIGKFQKMCFFISSHYFYHDTPPLAVKKSLTIAFRSFIMSMTPRGQTKYYKKLRKETKT